LSVEERMYRREEREKQGYDLGFGVGDLIEIFINV
jgi:hypothetical protein